MLFVCHSKILHKRCLKFLLGVKMAPRETENNAYAKFGVTNKEHYGMLWYFLEWSISSCFSCAYVEILSTSKVWRALKRLKLFSPVPQAPLTPLSCFPNFPRAQ